MAFNLNKSDESPKVDLSKKSGSTSKFDLSKTDEPPLPNEEKPGKSKTWLYALLTLILLGGGSWYFLSDSTNSTNAVANEVTPPTTVESKDAASQVNNQDEVASTTIDSPSSANSEMNNPTDVAPANNVNSTDNAPEKTAVPTITEDGDVIYETNAVPKTASASTNKGSSANLNNKVTASFASASSSLNNLNRSLVEEIVSFLGSNPTALITVNGYASSEGDLTMNQQLSQSRADIFKNYLVSKSIAQNRIVATGRGIDNPIASNDTQEGRRKNRRVEVSFE